MVVPQVGRLALGLALILPLASGRLRILSRLESIEGGVILGLGLGARFLFKIVLTSTNVKRSGHFVIDRLYNPSRLLTKRTTLKCVEQVDERLGVRPAIDNGASAGHQTTYAVERT